MRRTGTAEPGRCAPNPGRSLSGYPLHSPNPQDSLGERRLFPRTPLSEHTQWPTARAACPRGHRAQEVPVEGKETRATPLQGRPGASRIYSLEKLPTEWTRVIPGGRCPAGSCPVTRCRDPDGRRGPGPLQLGGTTGIWEGSRPLCPFWGLSGGRRVWL